jgi:hypothetical protein
VTGYSTAFGKDQNYNTQIAPFFCSQTSTSCPADPSTGLPIPSCSMYWDTGAGGQICQSWATANPASASATFTNYCTAKNTPDCTALSSPYVNSNPAGQTSWWSTWGWLIITIAAVVIFIGLFIWFFIVMRSKNDEIERIKMGQNPELMIQRPTYSSGPVVVHSPQYSPQYQ